MPIVVDAISDAVSTGALDGLVLFSHGSRSALNCAGGDPAADSKPTTWCSAWPFDMAADDLRCIVEAIVRRTCHHQTLPHEPSLINAHPRRLRFVTFFSPLVVPFCSLRW